MASPAQILNTTINKYVRKETLNITRRRRLLAALKKRGCISYNCDGDEISYPVRDKRTGLQTLGDVANLTFPRQRKNRMATLPYRGYSATDMYTELDKLKNRGQPAIVKYVTNMAKTLMGDIKDGFAPKLYTDGNASGFTSDIHGLQSCTGTSGASAGGYVGVPSDTYAGYNTGLGFYGGTWDGTWPAGDGDAQYDWWAPLIVDTTDGSWTGAATFAANAIEQLRYGILHQEARTDNRLDTIFLEKTMYSDFLDALDTKENIYTNRSKDNSLMISLGFTDVQTIDGVDVTYEQGTPAGQGFGLTFEPECIELCCMYDQLFKAFVPDFDVETLSNRFLITFYGNMKLNPRDLVTWKSVT